MKYEVDTMKKRSFSISGNHSWTYIAALALLLALALGTCAAAAESGLHVGTGTLVIETESVSDPAAEYISRALKPQRQAAARGWNIGDEFTGPAAYLYRQLYSGVQSIAAGRLSYTGFTFNVSDVLSKTTFTKAELGVSRLGISGSITDEANEALFDAIDEQVGPVLTSLTMDLPYDLFWYDKETGVSLNYDYDITGNDSSISLTGSFYVFFYVSGEYAGSDSFHVNAAYAGVEQAAQNAMEIVDKYSGCSDLEKLTAYRDEICALTDYNFEAVDPDNYAPYGNPWQLIWVFDGNPDTKVVCEGYSKAFQYLCELSTFQNEIYVTSVSGYMFNTEDGDGGGHMWNIVTMEDGKNYLVDVTNSDREGGAPRDDLFMKGYSDVTDDGSYLYKIGSTYFAYVYDEDTLNIPAPEKLDLSAEAYTPPIQLTQAEAAVGQGVAVSGETANLQYHDYTIGLQFPAGSLAAYFPGHPVFQIVYQAPGLSDPVAEEWLNLYSSLGVGRRGGYVNDDQIWFSADPMRFFGPGSYEITVRNYRADKTTLIFERTLSVTISEYNPALSFSVVFDKAVFLEGEMVTGKIYGANDALYTGDLDELEFTVAQDGLTKRRATWASGQSNVVYENGAFSFYAGCTGSVDVSASILIDTVWYASTNQETITVGSELPTIALALGQSAETGSLSAGGYRKFSFTPETSGSYVFRAESDYASSAVLLDADMQELASAQGVGFSLRFQLTAGETYYLKAYNDHSENASFTVTVTEAPTVTGINSVLIELEPNPNKQVHVTITAEPAGQANDQVWFVPADNDICAVTADGYITAKSSGLYVATAYADADHDITAPIFILVHGAVEITAQTSVDADGLAHVFLTCVSADGGALSEITMGVADPQAMLHLEDCVITASEGEIPAYTAMMDNEYEISRLTVYLPNINDTFPMNHTLELVFSLNNVENLTAGTELTFAIQYLSVWRDYVIDEGNGYYRLPFNQAVTVPASFTIVIPNAQNAYTDPDFVLPRDLSEIGEEAFFGIDAARVKLSEAVTKIGARAFAGCQSLESIYIPQSCTQIDPTAFGGRTDIEICGHAGSAAQTFAQQNGLTFINVD